MIPKRVLLVFGTFLLTVLLYVDRVCISVAKDDISEDLGFTAEQMGWVFSAFALGYALCQTPAGVMADRFGPRRILAGVVTFWSIFTGLTGAVSGYVSMLVVRALFGAGEAGAFPGLARATFSWIPMKERGIVQGINFSGSRLGAALALPLVAMMVEGMGWRVSFYVLAAVGIAWAAFWFWWFRDDPTEHSGISDKERAYILESRQQQSGGAAGKLPLGRMLGASNMWLVMLQYFCSNFTFFFALTWLFPHVKDTYDLNTGDAAFAAAIPLVAGAFGNWCSGFLVDFLYAKGKWALSRRLPAMLGFLLAAVGMCASIYMTSVVPAVFFLSVAIFGADMTLSPSWSFCIDIGKKHAGGVSGTMNMAGNIGSFLTALAFPYLQTFFDGSVTPFFICAAALNIIAVVCWGMMDPSRAIEE